MIDSSSGKHREIYLYTMSESWSSIGMPCQPAGSLTQTQRTMHDTSFGTMFATTRALEGWKGDDRRIALQHHVVPFPTANA
jgi:hypothetical protein